MKDEELEEIRSIMWDEWKYLEAKSLDQNKHEKIRNLYKDRAKATLDAMNIFTLMMNDGRFNRLIVVGKYEDV